MFSLKHAYTTKALRVWPKCYIGVVLVPSGLFVNTGGKRTSRNQSMLVGLQELSKTNITQGKYGNH